MPIEFLDEYNHHRGWQQGALKVCNSLVNKLIIEANNIKIKLYNILMETDTKPESVKHCSKCGENKTEDKFIKNRNICKDCRNIRSKELYNSIEIVSTLIQECNTCHQSKPLTEIVKNRTICKECNNSKRRNKYSSDEEHRLKLIQKASEFKHIKVLERQKIKLEEIGEDNKKCSVCFTIKNKCKFRYNRLKCRDCERDDPICKFKRNIRRRIWIALKKHKDLHTIQYLGCSSSEYLQWMVTYDEKYTLDNHGNDGWHIDHVIPLSHFNLENIEEQMIAFNWRNTMPLSAKENLSKNCKILTSQIEEHLEKLKIYHIENKLDLPQVFIDLFAKYLVVGNPLKPSLPP